MNIELKILDKEFYKKNEQLLSHPPKDVYNLPSYATSGSCAVDLYATKDYVIAPQERVKIPTGIAIYLGCKPANGGSNLQDYMGLITPRSGLGTKGLVLANTVGIIDSDYQGEIIVSAWNSNACCKEFLLYGQKGIEDNNENTLYIKSGDRIAQMSVVPVVVANWVVVDEFTEKTDRNDGGFNSTGG